MNAFVNDDVPMKAIRDQGTVLAVVIVAGAVFTYAAHSVVVAIVLFAIAGMGAAQAASNAPRETAERRFLWLVATTWLVMEVLACIGFSSRFWG